MIWDARDRCAFLLVSGLRLFLLPVVLSLFMVGLLAAQAPADKPAVEDQAPARQPAPTQQQLAEMQRLSETAEKYVAEGKTAEAMAAGDQLIALYGNSYGGVDTRVVSWLANLHLRCDDLDGARGMLQSSLQMAKERFGPDDWRTTDARLQLADVDLYAKLTSAQRREVFAATALIQRAVALFRAGKPAEALPMFEQGLATRKQLLGAEHSEYAKSLRQLSQMYHKQGALDRAGPPLREALEIQKRVLGTKHPDYSGSLNDLGALYFNQRDYSHARDALEESLELSKQQLGTNHPDYASGLCNLAVLYDLLGDYTRAESLHVEALEIRKDVLGKKHADYSTSLYELAGVKKRQGDFERAEELYREAVEVQRSVYGNQHPAYARSLNNLGTLYLLEGQYAQAEPLFREATEIVKKVLGEKHLEYATALNNLGNLYRSQGDAVQAQKLFRTAVEITKQAQGGRGREYTDKLFNLATSYLDQNDFAQAEPIMREALAVAERDLGTISPTYANCLFNLGRLYLRQTDYAQAEPLLEQTLEARKRILGPQHPDYALTLLDLAELHLQQGEYKQAEPQFQEALGIAQKAFGAKSSECALFMKGLGLFYQTTGDFTKAEPLIFGALQIARRQLDQAAGIQSERLQLSMRLFVWHYMNNYLDITAHTGTPAERVYHEVLNWKGLVGARQQSFRAVRRALAAQGNTKAVELETALATATHNLSALSRSTSVTGAEKQKQLELLGQQVEDLQQQLAAASLEYQKEFQQTRRTPEDLRRALPPDAMLIDVLLYGKLRPAKERLETPKDPQNAMAFIVRPGEPVERVELGPAEPIDRAIAAWRKSLASADDAATPLRRLLWSPLEKFVQDEKTVLISPNALVAPLPWGALPGKKPGSYLIDEYSFALIPIPSLLPDILASSPTRSATQEPSLMLVGDVNFGAEPSKTDAAPGNQVAARGDQPLHWQALPGTRDEVAAIKGEFHKRFGGGQITELTGDRATPSAVREEAGKHEYLHFSTHGFFAPAQIRSALSDKLLRDRSAGEETVSRESMSGFHPGLLSGLVLAGANQPVAAEREDGILTALEVSEMDLSRVQLATLSACETGLGETAGGEGMLGLQRAFQTAGAKTVIASLWKVPDRATQALMSRFHANLWQKKMSKLESLRDAQRWLIQAGLTQPELRRGLEIEEDKPLTPKSGPLSPYYWAAFVLSGDWR